MQKIKDLKPFIDFIDEETIIELKKNETDYRSRRKLREALYKEQQSNLTNAYNNWVEHIKFLKLNDDELDRLSGIQFWFDEMLKDDYLTVNHEFLQLLPKYYRDVQIPEELLVETDLIYGQIMTCITEMINTTKQCDL